MFAIMLRVQEIVKSQGRDMEWLAHKLGVRRESLYSRLKTGKIETLNQISIILKCPIQELIDAPKGYSHFYDHSTGEWLGIRKV